MHVDMEGMRTGEKGEETGPRMGQDTPTDRHSTQHADHEGQYTRALLHLHRQSTSRCVWDVEGGGEVHKA